MIDQRMIVELLNHLGYEWPMTDPDVLGRWAQQWRSIQAQLGSELGDLDDGVSHILGNNSGPVTEAFRAHMGSDESFLESLRSLVEAAPMVASGYEAAAHIITALRWAVIGEILADLVSLATAIASGGTAAAASFLLKQGAGAVIGMLLDKAVSDLLGG